MARIGSPYVNVSGLGLNGSVGRDADRILVWLRGEYDVSSVVALSELLARAIAIDESDLVVDLSEVEFMDAAMVGVLVRAHAFLGGRSRLLVLRSPSRMALRVLELCGLTDLLDRPLVDVTPMPGAASALGTWVAVPVSDRVDPRSDESSLEPSGAAEPARARRVTPAPTGSSADTHRPVDKRPAIVAGRDRA